MIRILEKENCCGCESCAQACPKQCISFNQDEQGFWYPKVDRHKCVNCGLCEKVCPILNSQTGELPSDVPLFAAYNTQESERQSSSSGGVFIQLAKKVIANNGVVFGATFDDDWNVVHSYAESCQELEKLKRSKYVQSRIKDCYRKAKNYLQKNRPVLFVGTPCQIAGLRAFLRKDYEQLVTVDVVCHGVPSPKVWSKYLEEKKRQFCGDKSIDDIEISNISFRSKEPSWRRYHLSFSFRLKRDGIDAIGPDSMFFTSSQYIWEDDYMLSFLKDYANRPSCFECRFRNGKCGSDITLADFWCIEKWTENQELSSDKGTSIVMLHTAKGKELFCKIDNLNFKSFTLQQATYGNPAILKSWRKPKFHDLYFLLVRNFTVGQSYRLTNLVQVKYEGCARLYARLKNKIKKLCKKN